MIEITVGTHKPTVGNVNTAATYCIAGVTVRCNEPIWPLEPYRHPHSLALTNHSNNVEHVDFRRPRLNTTTGWLGERVREVKTLTNSAGTEVYIKALGRLFVSADGHRIELPRWRDSRHRALIVEAAVGPALSLALAARGVFCLHASSVVCDGRATLFCGPSAAGKSTLAQRLPGHPGIDLRLTDDISPTRMVADELRCLGHFPQFKLGFDEHCRNPQSEEVPVERVVLLTGARDGAEFKSQVVEPGAAVIALARHTIASRLFSEEQMQQHLRYCCELVRRVHVLDVQYPHTGHGVDLIARLLSRDNQKAVGY